MCIYLPISPPPSPFLLPISLSSFTCYLLPPPLPHTSFSPTRSPLSFISFFLFLFDLYTLSFSYYSFIYLLLFPSSISSFFTASIVLCFLFFYFCPHPPSHFLLFHLYLHLTLIILSPCHLFSPILSFSFFFSLSSLLFLFYSFSPLYSLLFSSSFSFFFLTLEEAMPVKHQNVALDYIGKRGSAINVGRRERVQYAREILQKEVQRRIPFSAMKVYDDGYIKYLFTVIFYFLFFIFYFLFFQFFFVSVFVRFFPMSVQKKIVRRKKLFLWVTLCIKCLCAL